MSTRFARKKTRKLTAAYSRSIGMRLPRLFAATMSSIRFFTSPIWWCFSNSASKDSNLLPLAWTLLTQFLEIQIPSPSHALLVWNLIVARMLYGLEDRNPIQFATHILSNGYRLIIMCHGRACKSVTIDLYRAKRLRNKWDSCTTGTFTQNYSRYPIVSLWFSRKEQLRNDRSVKLLQLKYERFRYVTQHVLYTVYIRAYIFI